MMELDRFVGEILKTLKKNGLDNDIGETKNLAAQYPQIVEELKNIAGSARAKPGDRILNKKGKGVRKPGRIYQEKEKVINLATGKKISIKNMFAHQYSGCGDITLINGESGSLDYSNEEWLFVNEIIVE
jgi:hypothetical protein